MAGGGNNILAILKEVESSIVSDSELEYFLIHQNRYRYILNKILSLKLSPDSQVLDVGCFPLHLFTALKKMGYKLWGISSKHESIKSKEIVSLNIEQDKLPFEANFFDLIVFTEIMEHLVGSPGNYLDKLKRVLKKGGRLIVTTPNAVHLKNRAKVILGKNIYFSLSQLEETNLNSDSIYFRHNREYTKGELVELFTNQGFKIVRADYFNSYSPFRRKKAVEQPILKVAKIGGFLLTYIYPALKDTIYLELEKE